MHYRIEKDTMGEVRVPKEKYWGAQTQRSVENFRIGPPGSMPSEVIRAFGCVKKAAAITNCELGELSVEKMNAIAMVCDEIIAGELAEHFPLVIWQTGSGTQTNMNVNEVIANRAHVLLGNSIGHGSLLLHPHDDVNKSQSSNDTFPTAMHIAACTSLATITLPGLRQLHSELSLKAEAFGSLVKIGRTHFMDAVPLTLGQEFSGYASQLEKGITALVTSVSPLSELALGATAVGTGLNAPNGFAAKAADAIAMLTGLPFITAGNKFAALAAHDAMVVAHASLKSIAVVLMKITNDIRFLASGPRCAIGEIVLPSNEPGSSIMPGKVNPTQAEALAMICAQVMGNDVVMTVAGSGGVLELNTFKPVMIAAFLQSAQLIGEGCRSFAEKCVRGIYPDHERMQRHLENSLMLVTALNAHIGYEKSATIAQKAFREKTTLRDAAVSTGYVTHQQFDEWVNPQNMIG
ncbi:class II fumarate hydratase [Chlorobium phaeobacteroides]|uniref:Fumarate hydratase class II n=1 Tax=Chlorobium phaeobacteroides (strain DSM 266 / SMG 266 / 2430) TaxID=290317 RepID=A1BFP4_CHLPD|nr:class II fumarate hydratase [Chlorobium phaeobacteroides]ABL65221.1 fumarate hydratase, class II [Chlorobium phaeobacteroides DSM 266]